MTLVITAIAAALVTAIRFGRPAAARSAHLGFLALVYWGAAVMWSVDGIAALAEGGPFVELADKSAVKDDAVLGAYVLLLGLAVWGVYLLARKAAASSRT
jgi:hypothetical protein